MFRFRVNVSTIFLLVILQGAALVLFCGWYFQLSPCTSPSSNGKVHILLLSSWRSGSSFLGQVFNQHPSVFYLMEPGWHIWSKVQRPKQVLRVLLRDLYRGLFQCEISGLEGYMIPKNVLTNVFMWSHSQALCSPPACPLTPRGELSDQHQCYEKCNSTEMQVLKTACDTYSHVVLKEVRFFDIDSLYPLFQDPSLDLRIIHLVRDPRAVFRSREKAAGALGLDSAIVTDHRTIPAADIQFEVLKEICRSHVHIGDSVIQKSPSFLKGRYKMVRYEDLVRNPIEEIKDLYQFAGLEMKGELVEWIYRLTHGKGTGSRGEEFKITSRDAADVSEAWRTTLPFNKVKRVQEVCQGAMKMIGYRNVNSEKEQKNPDIHLIVPKEPFKFTWLPPKLGEQTKNEIEKRMTKTLI